MAKEATPSEHGTVSAAAASPFFIPVPEEEAVEIPRFRINTDLPLFQEPDAANAIRVTYLIDDDSSAGADSDTGDSSSSRRARRRERGEHDSSARAPRSSQNDAAAPEESGHEETDDTSVAPTRRRRRSLSSDDEVAAPKGSTRLAAKRARRRENREGSARRRGSITEVEYLARRESVKRDMIVRERDGLNQIAVLEDDVLVEHYVARHTQISMVGNVYLGRVQNVLPSMEAAFVDIGKGRNAVLYAGEVDWKAAGVTGKNRRIEQALKSGDTVLVQVTKDPIGHKGARLTSQVTLAGRHLVLVPGGDMTGISRKLPDSERSRLKKLLKEIVPEDHGVIVRTAAEGATAEQLKNDVERLTKSWKEIQRKAKAAKTAPQVLKSEPELAVRVVRDIFNEDFDSLRVQGEDAWETISTYVEELSPELMDRVSRWDDSRDIFEAYRVEEQLAKAFDRKVWLPSGGTLVIDRTEAMTVVDVNTGKFTGSGGSLEETVTRNNLEAAEEIVRQLRLRDIGGIVVIDFIDMVLESNRDLVLRRLIECLGRDRTRHQVAEVTSLGLVQMTRKRVGQGLVEAFSTVCEACEGRGYIIHDHPVEENEESHAPRKRKNRREASAPQREAAVQMMNSIAAAGHADAQQKDSQEKDSAKPDKQDNQDKSEQSGKPAESGKSVNSQKLEKAEKLEKPEKQPATRRRRSSRTATAVVDTPGADAKNAAVTGTAGAGTSTASAGSARKVGMVVSSGVVSPAHAAVSPSSHAKTVSPSSAIHTGSREPANGSRSGTKRRAVVSSGPISTGNGAGVLSFPANSRG
ncbi:Rne/Rng family ribonuclease [Actinotignum sp. SLA_B059]|uniref:Rne/Rng family ribonuclease n=1 Tax=Actinotignum sp. SLA_B059 TaxID=3083287 RepID=UPI002A813714|nr:Rne/Rng family ribonuclease [Actinotignum sp. SLA_B059]MDY5126557.1 Rne/Rng family ribonuclease [Actinotignum sp. SLA_B059]